MNKTVRSTITYGTTGVLAFVAGLAIGGAGGGELTGVASMPTPLPSLTVATPAPAAATVKPTSEYVTADTVLAFGATARFKTGAVLTIDAPRPVETHGEFDDVAPKGTHVVAFSVTLKNTSNKPLDPSMFVLTVTSGQVESTALYLDNLPAVPETKLLPGRSVKWDEGFAVRDPKAVTAQADADVANWSGANTMVLYDSAVTR